MIYNWQMEGWPEFRFDLAALRDGLMVFAEKTGRISGALSGLSDDEQKATDLDLLVVEAIKTSEIEGEFVSRRDVMSSVRNQLGLNATPEPVHDKRAQGIADLILAVRESYHQALSKAMLFSWHKSLLPHARNIKTGAWRTHAEPMQVISGGPGREVIHFEAPPSKQVPAEMKQFTGWFNRTAPGKAEAIKDGPVRSAIAHLYFESVHPFEDGNGRIGRAISEKALAQSFGRPALLSLSRSIEAHWKDYYEALEAAQRAEDVTDWMLFFLDMVLDAQTHVEELIAFTLKKSKFFDRYGGQFNDRQLKVIRRMLSEGPQGFEGGMTAKKYMAITGTSKATATRDMQQLAAIEVFAAVGGGRSTRYDVVVG